MIDLAVEMAKTPVKLPPELLDAPVLRPSVTRRVSCGYRVGELPGSLQPRVHVERPFKNVRGLYG